MHEEIVISGFGGQGSCSPGSFLRIPPWQKANMLQWIPSYGPEMRGGTAYRTVIISDEEIGSPLVRNPTAVMIFQPPSMARYAPLVKPNGVLVLDSTSVDPTLES
jgi:2-oxoglutarate ferredoxin oxidoreductase subunit gamma